MLFQQGGQVGSQPTAEDSAGGQGVQDFSSSAFLPSDTLGYPKREYKGFAPSVTPAEQQAIRNDPNIRIYDIIQPKRTKRGSYVTGPVLFDSEGKIAGRNYDLEDPFVVQRELYKLKTDERVSIANELKRIGWYGDRKPSQALIDGIGWDSNDEQVFAKLLNLANTSQRRWQDVVGLLGNFPSTGGAGVSVRVTSDEDAAAYTREVFLQQLGRMPTRMEMAQAANFIRTRERQAVASGQQVPNTGLIAEAFAQKADPTSRVVYGLGNAISLAFQALGK